MELFLIRHGESTNNALEDSSKRVADPELTDKGRVQAEAVAEYLSKSLHLSSAERRIDRPGFDRLYCSPMIRAMHTAEPIGRELDLAPEIWVDIHENGGIYLDHGEERGKVGYPGQTRAEIAARFPTIIASKAVGENGWWKAGMEENHQSQGRVIAVATELVARAGEDARIALVMHGGSMSMLIQALANQLPGGGATYEHENTAITRIALAPQRSMVIEYLNRTEHLADDRKLVRGTDGEGGNG